jgi:hypothetical protein
VVIAAALAVAYFAGDVHGGFLLWFVIPFVAPWAIWSLHKAAAESSSRRLRMAKIFIWIVAIAIVGTLHRNYAIAARAEAERAARAVLAFESVNGRYPPSLADAGVVAADSRWRVGYGLDERGRPWLIYPATFVVFETWSYDFSALKWVYRPD